VACAAIMPASCVCRHWRCCCCRLPASTTPRQRLQVVAAAIDVLGLDDVRHQLIGNEEVGTTQQQLGALLVFHAAL
jgi:hypothetical protein